MLTLAQLLTQRTKEDAGRRYAAKWRLTKLLFQHGWSKKRIIILFKAINWMMTLPAELEGQYWPAVLRGKQERKMEYISSLEQMFIDKGQVKGAAFVLAEQLTQRFGPLSQTTRRKLAKANLEQLRVWSKAVLDAQSLKEVFNATELSKTH